MENQYCKICFNEIKDKSLHAMLFKHRFICDKCFKNFDAKFIHFKIDSIKGLSIYEYDDNIKNLIYVFKGSYDIELKDVFLDRYYWYLKFIYQGYVMVPIPSYHLEDDKRGFNHVVEIFNRLKLPMLKIIRKTKDVKQAKQHKKERLNALKNFEIIDLEKIRNKKVLIVDDVFTTGSSMRAAIELVKQGKPKQIQVLVIAKNKEKTHYP